MVYMQFTPWVHCNPQNASDILLVSNIFTMIEYPVTLLKKCRANLSLNREFKTMIPALVLSILEVSAQLHKNAQVIAGEWE